MNQTQNHRPDTSESNGYAAAMAGRTQADHREHGLMVNYVGHDDHDDGLVHRHEWAATK